MSCHLAISLAESQILTFCPLTPLVFLFPTGFSFFFFFFPGGGGWEGGEGFYAGLKVFF